MFQNRRLYIATNHRKEEVIQPLFESKLKVQCVVPEDFDSDSLGTFSGEIERPFSPIETARKKCAIVAEKYNTDLVIASEGSFGPHPLFGLVPMDEEILVFMDLKNKLEIIHVERTIKTNFCSEQIETVQDLTKFAEKVGFPSHGLILKGKLNGKEKYFKGIVDHSMLIKYFLSLKKRQDTITGETDMRAMFNPTRMEIIQQAAINLVKKINNLCPNCASPGFGAERSIPGLPCAQCSLPTRSIKANIFQCLKCSFEQEVEITSHNKTEDPMYCDFCNP